MNRDALTNIDASVIRFMNKVSDPFSRVALFVVYFWFGLLKIVAESPANPLVASLLERTLPFVSFDQFILFLGLFEMIIGVAFLIPGLERLAVVLLIPHMITTTMPLILLPAIAWQAPLVPTLEGQYIIKNLLIIALALGLVAHLHPLHWRREHRS
ncbi:MAG: hypothetical protein WD972_00875 [Candidatus Andersenbacteria bacterium]